VKAVPLTRDQANAFVCEHHRHHGRVQGHRYAVGVEIEGRLVGVAIVGRPRARRVDQYRTAEVSRVCTDGTKNACSFLLARCSRLCRELGFDRVFTEILETETGASLKASGWVLEYTHKGESQDRPSRRRVDKSPTCPKQVWAPDWCARGQQ
jgi:hypothetical protein